MISKFGEAPQKQKLSQHQKKKLRKQRLRENQELEEQKSMVKSQMKTNVADVNMTKESSFDISEIQWQQLSISRLSRGSKDYSQTEKFILANLDTHGADSKGSTPTNQGRTTPRGIGKVLQSIQNADNNLSEVQENQEDAEEVDM